MITTFQKMVDLWFDISGIVDFLQIRNITLDNIFSIINDKSNIHLWFNLIKFALHRN